MRSTESNCVVAMGWPALVVARLAILGWNSSVLAIAATTIHNVSEFANYLASAGSSVLHVQVSAPLRVMQDGCIVW